MEDPKQNEAPVPEPLPPAEGLQPPATPSPFDQLFTTPEEAERVVKAHQALVEAAKQDMEEPERPLAEEVDRICAAVDRLAKKGLNLRAIIALLHDANPSIPKKHIKTVLEGLRELPAIYGKSK